MVRTSTARRTRAAHLRVDDARRHRAELPGLCRILGATLAFHQSNYEGELVDLIQSARRNADAIIINPAAYSFTSIAIYDALKTFAGPIIELHISNIHARDEMHRHSKLSSAVKAVICGLGPYGYIVAMQAAAQLLGRLPDTWPACLREGRADLLRDAVGTVCDCLWQEPFFTDTPGPNQT